MEEHGVFVEGRTGTATAGGNLPRQLIETTRVRKGLAIERKVVEHAEKQRTITRNK
jgi:hypothetical protein